MWKEGSIRVNGEVFHYWMKQYDKGSEWGIEGGRISNVMCPVRTVQFQRTNWTKNNQLQPITYEFCIAV